MIKINVKYLLITFFIIIVSSFAIFFIVVNDNDDSAATELVTCVTSDAETLGNSVESNYTKDKNTVTKKSTKTATEKKTTEKHTVTAQTKKITTTAVTVKFPLDINEVTKSELMQIDGVGESTANKIISYRKKLKFYTNLLQLKEISGIGDATYKKLSKYLYVSKDKYQEMTEEQKTSYSKENIKTTTKKSKYSSSTQTQKKQMRMVNINTADAEELKDCLLIDDKEALAIIELRESIGGEYTNTLELLMAIEVNEYNRIKDYVTV